MPNKSKFKTHQDYLDWYADYRKKNREKLRKYFRKYNSEWRKENGYHNEEKWAKENREKKNAHQVLYYHVKMGNIARENCEVCDKENAQAHHDDYTKPLEVRWLCPIHHKEYHLKLKEKATKIHKNTNNRQINRETV